MRIENLLLWKLVRVQSSQLCQSSTKSANKLLPSAHITWECNPRSQLGPAHAANWIIILLFLVLRAETTGNLLNCTPLLNSLTLTTAVTSSGAYDQIRVERSVMIRIEPQYTISSQA